MSIITLLTNDTLKHFGFLNAKQEAPLKILIYLWTHLWHIAELQNLCLPILFFCSENKLGFKLPQAGDYATGIFFIDTDPNKVNMQFL